MDDSEFAAAQARMDQGVKAFEEVANAMVKYYTTLVEGGVPEAVANRMVEGLSEEWAKGTFGPKMDFGKLLGGQ